MHHATLLQRERLGYLRNNLLSAEEKSAEQQARRERIAVAIAAGVEANSSVALDETETATYAVKMADALIDELDKPSG